MRCPGMMEKPSGVGVDLSDMGVGLKLVVVKDPAIIGESTPVPEQVQPEIPASDPAPVREIGGRKGPEPTRYGDWEMNGRCIDF